ncbi:YkvI family membrane protein [Calderihabitans maritimus]|uniref:Membrane protein YkvI n=1 Tax=Calderihabitans maritimus TaxID=1246530 RepID=A0A1Z5HNP0_9FIRM|nr:hypothetical protein [Calderihabitans maritimus]GAW90915.1 hypothetical protein Moth_1876 [Calderihabitans maritimus]
MQKKLSTFAIAATYVGTVVGAGFASGQEVLQFFGFYGKWGLIGIIISTVLFIFFGISIMELGHELKAKSHLPVIRAAGGRWTGTAIDAVITFFLFGALVTMAAGAGAIFVEQFKLPALWGSLLMVILTLVTVLLGISRVIESISFIAPILLTSVLVLSLATVFSNPQAFIVNLNWSNTAKAAVPYWPLAAILYASYNLVLAVAVLAPLGALSEPGKLRLGAVWGGLGLGIGVLAIVAAILTTAPQVTGLEVPMIAIAGRISPLARTAYSVVLFAEVYTTAVASLYGFASRLTDPDSNNYKWLVTGASGVAFASAQFGFSNIVGTLFPAVGIAGLLLLGSLTYGYFKTLRLGILEPVPAAKPALELPDDNKQKKRSPTKGVKE